MTKPIILVEKIEQVGDEEFDSVLDAVEHIRKNGHLGTLYPIRVYDEIECYETKVRKIRRKSTKETSS